MHFKKEMTETDLMKVESNLFDYFNSRTFKNHRGESRIIRARNFEDIFGLAYISSGPYALVTLSTNEHIFSNDVPGFYFDHAAMDEEGNVWIELLNEEEKTMLIKL